MDPEYDEDLRKRFKAKFIGGGKLKRFCEERNLNYKTMRQYTAGIQRMTKNIAMIMEKGLRGE